MEKEIDKPKDPIKYGLSDGNRIITFDPNLFENCPTCFGQGKLNPFKGKNQSKCTLCNGRGIMGRMP